MRTGCWRERTFTADRITVCLVICCQDREGCGHNLLICLGSGGIGGWKRGRRGLAGCSKRKGRGERVYGAKPLYILFGSHHHP